MDSFIGIDPGYGGGIAVLHATGKILHLAKMPATEKDTFLGITELEAEFAVIEHVHSMPKQGVASSFKFGRNYGFCRGCLVAAGIPFDEVTPRTWMKSLGIRTKGKDETPTQWKNHLKQVSQQLFPQAKVTLKTCDALLIAEFCRRTYVEKLR